MTIGTEKQRELFNTISLTNATYEASTTPLKTHFNSPTKTSLQNTTSSFPVNQLMPGNIWLLDYTAITKCKRNHINFEATKLVFALHTHSKKLQPAIIQKGMIINKVISIAKSLELAQWEMWFMEKHMLH